MSEQVQVQSVASRGQQQVTAISPFLNAESFESAQRMAKLLCASAIIPQTYQGKIQDCVIALEMASRIGASPLAVMQQLYVVHGRPAWSSQFLIACVNASGRFTPLRYRLDGDGDNCGCVAWAKDKSGEVLEGPRVSIKMAKDEGWFSKSGSKWKTMPELMLRYRAATLFARLYAPELTMGINTQEEVDDVVDIAPVVTDPVQQQRQPRQSRQPRQAVTVSNDIPAELMATTTGVAESSVAIPDTATFMKAIEGIPFDLLNSYLIEKCYINPGQNYMEMEARHKAELVATPDLHSVISRWADEQFNGQP